MIKKRQYFKNQIYWLYYKEQTVDWIRQHAQSTFTRMHDSGKTVNKVVQLNRLCGQLPKNFLILLLVLIPMRRQCS